MRHSVIIIRTTYKFFCILTDEGLYGTFLSGFVTLVFAIFLVRVLGNAFWIFFITLPFDCLLLKRFLLSLLSLSSFLFLLSQLSFSFFNTIDFPLFFRLDFVRSFFFLSKSVLLFYLFMLLIC